MVENERPSTFLRIDRQIIAGAESFASKVDYFAKEVFGHEYVTSVTETVIPSWVDEGVSHEPVKRLVPVGPARAQVYPAGSLRMLLIERSVPAGLSADYDFAYQAGRFSDISAKTLRGQVEHDAAGRAYIASDAFEILDELSRKAELEPLETPVVCDRIDVVERSHGGIELAVFPAVKSMAKFVLEQQVDYCFTRLANQPGRSVYPTGPSSPHVPFVRLPKDTTYQQYERFAERLQSSDVLPVRLVMGGVQVYANAQSGANSR